MQGAQASTLLEVWKPSQMTPGSDHITSIISSSQSMNGNTGTAELFNDYLSITPSLLFQYSQSSKSAAMSSTPKIITVFGSTRQQGDSVARSLLDNNPSKSVALHEARSPKPPKPCLPREPPLSTPMDGGKRNLLRLLREAEVPSLILNQKIRSAGHLSRT